MGRGMPMNDHNRPPPTSLSGASTVVCPTHGLRFDPSQSVGCVRCRAAVAPPPGSRRALYICAALVGIGLVIAVVGQVLPLAGFTVRRYFAIPIPGPNAAPEPLPEAGPEGIALAEARTDLDNYELDAGRAILLDVLRKNPESAIAHAYLARAAFKSGLRTDGTCDARAVAMAEEEIRKADQLAPGSPDSRLMQGWLRYTAKDPEGARAIALEVERGGGLPGRASYLIAHIETGGQHASADQIADAERRAKALIDSVSEGFLLAQSYGVLDDVYRLRGDDRARYALQQFVESRHLRDSRGQKR
jgi:hypothetical protein